jgi:[protein-PII] uridylyltransferase
MPSHLAEEELEAHFAHLPARYFQIHSPKQVVSDLERVQRFLELQLHEEDKALEPVIDWHNEPDRGYAAVHVCTWDRARLFSKITGCLTAAGLNILSAQIFSRTDGVILDTFFVTDAKTGLLPVREEREKFERFLHAALTGSLDLPPLIARQKVSVPIYRALEGEQIPTVVHFDSETSDNYTIIDIQTEDRVGLLYIISQTLAELSLDIALAKICTEKGAAMDSFYVAQADNRKVTSPEYQKFTSGKLKAAIASLDPS